MKPAYSYHSFLLPFFYSPKEQRTMDAYNPWKPCPLSIRQDGGVGYEMQDGASADSFAATYAASQYFSPEAQELLFGAGHHLVYQLPPEATYEIVHGETQYTLQVRSIHLILLQEEEVGVLILNTENQQAVSVDAVKAINEYGRRIELPFLSEPGQPHPVVADRITLLGQSFDFLRRQQQLYETQHLAEMQIAAPFLGLLESCPQLKEAKITPAVDDRMFVHSMICDEPLSHRVAEGKLAEDALYALTFVDAGDATCQNEEMRHELLERCSYKRWQKYGTLDVVTHHSYLRITGAAEGLWEGVHRPFLSIYCGISAVALLQRALLLHMSKKSATLSNQLRKDLTGRKPKVSHRVREQIAALNVQFIHARNTVFLHELTAQEQGIEVFNLLKQELYLSDTLEDVDQKMGKLYDLSQIYVEQEENRLLGLLAVAGIPLAASPLLLELMRVPGEFETVAQWLPSWWPWVEIGLPVLLGLGLFALLNRHWKKKR